MKRILAVALSVVVAGPGRAQMLAPLPAPPAMPNLLSAPPPSWRKESPASPPALRPENFHAFSTKDLRLTWTNRRWQIVSGTQVVKDFGPRENDARQALHIIQDLGLTQHAEIGSPAPVMEYWLADGKAPHGLVRAGLRAVALDPAALRVEQSQGQWCLRDRNRILFNFGPRAEDAQQALAVIRKYNFDQLGLVGQSVPSMYVFLSRAAGGPATLPQAHGAGATGRHLDSPQFSRLAKNRDGTPRFEKTAGPQTSSALEGLAVAAVPPLTNHAGARVADQPKPFRWQAPTAPAQAAVSQESERLPFDWRQVSMLQEQGEWRLKAGGTVLANFGTSIHDARLALSALRHYRFAEQHRLGVPQTYMTYYVANGAAPRGVMLGVPTVEFKPEQLVVKQVATGFALCQGERVVLRLRDREDDGRKLLESIKRNRCDRLCKIGEPGKEAMTFLVRSR